MFVKHFGLLLVPDSKYGFRVVFGKMVRFIDESGNVKRAKKSLEK